MDKALASGAGDCGFESHRDRFLQLRWVNWSFGIKILKKIETHKSLLMFITKNKNYTKNRDKFIVKIITK